MSSAQQRFKEAPEASPGQGRAPRSLRARAAGRTDAGKVRPRNEDRFLVAHPVGAARDWSPGPAERGAWRGVLDCSLLVVADGMGGYQAGDVASALAVATIEELVLPALQSLVWFGAPSEGELLTTLQGAFREADDRLFERSAAHEYLARMGTTLTIACHVGDWLYVAHAGDSRCYLLRAGQLQQLTLDHTVVQEMVRAGHVTPAGAAHHRLRHVVTNAIGGGFKGVEVETHQLRLDPGDALLLCTDGLTEMMTDEQIRAVLGTKDARVACEDLVEEANERGGRDNVTALVARFD